MRFPVAIPVLHKPPELLKDKQGSPGLETAGRSPTIKDIAKHRGTLREQPAC
jgi:hypothetical protein